MPRNLRWVPSGTSSWVLQDRDRISLVNRANVLGPNMTLMLWTDKEDYWEDVTPAHPLSLAELKALGTMLVNLGLDTGP